MLSKQCPQCGRTVSLADIQGGLCPFCRLERGMAASDERFLSSPSWLEIMLLVAGVVLMILVVFR